MMQPLGAVAGGLVAFAALSLTGACSVTQARPEAEDENTAIAGDSGGDCATQNDSPAAACSAEAASKVESEVPKRAGARLRSVRPMGKLTRDEVRSD